MTELGENCCIIAFSPTWLWHCQYYQCQPRWTDGLIHELIFYDVSNIQPDVPGKYREDPTLYRGVIISNWILSETERRRTYKRTI